MVDICVHLKHAGFVSLTNGVLTAIDEVAVDEYGGGVWTLVFYRDNGGGAQADRLIYQIMWVHDGTPTLDATSGGTSYEVIGGAQAGPNSKADKDVAFDLALTGSGASQKVQLIVQASTAGWQVSRSRGIHVGAAP